MRVLHLIDPENSHVGPCGTALLAEGLRPADVRDGRSSVLLLGTASAERMASEAGIEHTDRVGARGGQSWMAAPAVRRYLSAARPFDLIHCWSLATLTLATLVAPNTPRVLTLTMGPAAPGAAHWLRMLCTTALGAAGITGPTAALAVSSTTKRAWVQLGVDPSAIHVLRPGLNFSRIQTEARSNLRRRWGIASEETTVVALMADPGSRVDAWRVARILTLANLMKLDVALVVPPTAVRRHLAYELAAVGRAADRLIVDDLLQSPWHVLPGCDVALVLGDDTSEPTPARGGEASGNGYASNGRTPRSRMQTLAGAWLAWREAKSVDLHTVDAPPPHQCMTGILPMLWAGAAGVPIIAESSYAVSELIEHRHTGLLVKPGDDNAIVRRCQELIDEPHLTWKLKDTARSEIFSVCSRQRYASDLALVYDQIKAGHPVSVPELKITGGIRFDGR